MQNPDYPGMEKFGTEITSWLNTVNFDNCEWCPRIESGKNLKTFSTICF